MILDTMIYFTESLLIKVITICSIFTFLAIHRNFELLNFEPLNGYMLF